MGLRDAVKKVNAKKAAKKAAAAAASTPANLTHQGPDMSALPINNNVLATVLGSPVQIGEGTISFGGITYDGVSGTSYPTVCTDCANSKLPGVSSQPLAAVYGPAMPPAPGIIDVNIDGTMLAVAAVAAWYFFLRKS